MALPSNGAISLNQMHIEVGGSSGSTASLNDSDIRGLISKSSGATMAFNEWYGASNFTADGTFTGTTGEDTSSIITGNEEIYTAIEKNGEITLIKQ